jgi:hypothetical protein
MIPLVVANSVVRLFEWGQLGECVICRLVPVKFMWNTQFCAVKERGRLPKHICSLKNKNTGNRY